MPTEAEVSQSAATAKAETANQPDVEFKFESLRERVTKDLEAETETPAEEATPAPVETQPVQEAETTEVEETPAEEATEEVQPGDVYELKVTGKNLILDREQVIDFAQKGIDYTRKTMQLADERKQLEQAGQQLAGVVAEWNKFLTDPVRLAQHLEKIRGVSQPVQPSQPGPTLDPTDVPTAADMDARIAAAEAKWRAEQEEKDRKAQLAWQEQEAQRQVAALTADFTQKIDTKLNELIGKHTVLDATDSEAIKLETAKRLQQSPTDDLNVVFGVMQDIVKTKAEAREKVLQNHAKMQAVRKAKAEKTIQPPGGSSPLAPPAQQFKLGDKRLTQSVIDAIKAAGG